MSSKQSENGPRELALQRAASLSAGLALDAFALDSPLGGWMALNLDEGDNTEGRVELAVAAPVEP